MNKVSPEVSVSQHYNEFAESYRSWTEDSEAGLHFGIVSKFSDIFSNARMIRNLSDLVISQIDGNVSEKILDAGCGLGHIMVMIEQDKSFHAPKLYGVTISEHQGIAGNNFLSAKNSRAQILIQSYESTSFETSYFDTILYVESLSYGAGSDKESALREVARIIKPGGKVVIADAFLKKRFQNFGALFRFLGQKTKKFWGIEDWIVEKEFLETAKNYNFVVEKNIDLKWRTAPSLLHVLFKWFPYVVVQYILRKMPFSSVKFVAKIILYVMPFGSHPAFRYKCIVLKKVT